MASNNGSQAPIGQNKQTNIPFNGHPGANASLFLEKTKAGMRGSTPDSEALASSDDELDHHHRVQPVNVIQSSRPTRRPSWLSETQHVPQRKGSLGSGGTFSPTHTFNSTPPGEQGVWGSNGAPPTSSVGRGHSSSGSIPWGSAIWSSDSQKGPPSRLTEVLPSPTTVVQSASNNLPVDESLLSPTLGREASNESSFPFAIPLHPTLKTYRSQSYSVGQLDPEAMSLPSSNLSGHHLNSRSRSGIPYAGLHRRPSRSSALGDMSHDSSLLGQLREVDDDESSTGSEAGVQLSATQARAIEKLAMENALLRQAAAEQIEDNTKARNRAVSTNSVPRLPRTSIQAHHQRVHETVPEEPSGGLHRLDETQTEPFSQGGVRSRRSTEYISRSGQQYNSSTLLENRNLESIKKGHWQSSLGFGGLVEPPQSRRHSFAEVPTRQTSISSASEQQNGHGGGENGIRPSTGHRSPVGYRDSSARLSQGDTGEYAHFRLRQNCEEKQLELKHLRDRSFAASYFSGMDPSMRSPDIHGHPSMSPVMVQHGYSTHHPYGRPQSSANPPSRPTQLLYVVTFKACRADVFYVSEGTGLQIRPGDLVIVEADRGTDLGTVAYDHLSLSKAKDLKDFYTEEHYRWLMMFSRRGQTAGSSLGAPNQPNPSSGLQTSAVGAVGAAGQSQDISGAELKPKMIKRLAQAHEIQTLRDKEGNEAKAKRVCQQKVVEHRLNMEVLDAEFQMFVDFHP